MIYDVLVELPASSSPGDGEVVQAGERWPELADDSVGRGLGHSEQQGQLAQGQVRPPVDGRPAALGPPAAGSTAGPFDEVGSVCVCAAASRMAPMSSGLIADRRSKLGLVRRAMT